MDGRDLPSGGRGGSGNSNGNGKGKGKEVVLPSETDADQNRESESIFGRVANSISGLGDSLLTSRPKGDDLGEILPAQKFESSSHGQAHGAIEGSVSCQPSESKAGESFRKVHMEEHVAWQEKAFSNFLSGAGGSSSVEPLGVGSGDARLSAISHGQGLQARENPSSAVAEQESRDGADAVNLLSRGWECAPDSVDDAEVSRDAAEQLHRALFGGAGTDMATSQEWDNVLNFIPDFVRPCPSGEKTYRASDQWKQGETSSHLGMAHSAEAARVWVEQWHDVLTRYTDEVWGDLGTLVKQAREELREVQVSRQAPEDDASIRALERLRQILGHIRGTSWKT